MLIDSKNNFFQAIQNIAEDVNLADFVEKVSANINVAQTALQSVDLLQLAPPAGIVSTAAASTAAFAALPQIDAGTIVRTTIDSVVRQVGSSAGKAIDSMFPDLKHDGETSSFSPSGTKTETEGDVFVVNGVDMDQSKSEGMAKDTAARLGKNTTLVHNATAGRPLDAIEYMKETFLGIPSPPSQKLSDEMYERLKAGKNVEVVAYSQGSTQTTIALSLTVARLKADGKTDQEIKDIMKNQMKVTYVGTPVDPNNPMQFIWNVPPGPPIPFVTTRLDSYFQKEDVVLHGENPPTSQTTTKHDSGETNFRMIRHENDPVANWVRDVGPADALFLAGGLRGAFAFLDPVWVGYGGYRAATLIGLLGINTVQENEPFGYHDWQDYEAYLKSGGVPETAETANEAIAQDIEATYGRKHNDYE